MKKLVVILGLLLAACFSGGCAVVPALVTTGASFAVPQTVSVAITAAGTVHKTVLVAADERQVDEMISDKMTTIQAQTVLLTESGVDMEATCLNGDIYVVGEYATPADRDSAIEALKELKGVKTVKGVVKQMPTSLAALVEPAIADNHAETIIETGLIKELHIKSANVDVEVVQGEAVILGVVKDAAEAEDVVRLVHGLRPKSKTPVTVTSLLALQDAFEADLPQPNDMFALRTQMQMLADAKAAAPAINEEKPQNAGDSDFGADKPSIMELAANIPDERTPWQKARLKMKRRILELAKKEADPKAKRELITLSSRVCKDQYVSIEDRLVKTLHSTSSLTVRKHINTVLIEFAPHRTLPVWAIAMH